MLNLYILKFAHFSQKDHETGIKKFILASSDEEVYEQCFGKEYEGQDVVWDEDLKKEISFKEDVIKNRGTLHRHDWLVDLYYGETLKYWELVDENPPKEVIEYLKLKNLI